MEMGGSKAKVYNSIWTALAGLLGILFRRVINNLLKSLNFSFLFTFILEISKNKIHDVLSSPNYVINAVSNCFHEVINLGARLKNHDDAIPWKVK